MAMTRAQMVTEICNVVGKALGASAPSGALLQDRVVTYLNWGQKRIARVYDFDELNTLLTTPTLVADVKRYPLESGTNNLGLTRVKDISSIRLIDAENSRKLERWSYRKLDKRFPRPENYSTGRPSVYVRHGNYLEFFKIPDDTYSLSVRISQWAQDLSSTSQTSDFQDKDELLVTVGVLETYLALEEYSDAKIWFEKFMGEMRDCISAESDVDWEPQAVPFGSIVSYGSGEPWKDPYGSAGDPLWNYPE